METELRFSKSSKVFILPIGLPNGWSAKALPDGTMVILQYKPFGDALGTVTINEVDRTYAFGAGTKDSLMKIYSGRNWRKRLYLDAIEALDRLLG